MKGWRWALVGGVILLAGAAGWWWLRELAPEVAAAGALPPTAVAARGAIRDVISGTGSVQAAAREDILAQAAGTIQELFIKKNGTVTKGQTVARLNNETLRLQIERTRIDRRIKQQELDELIGQGGSQDVYLPASGRIKELKVKEGQEVQKNSSLATIFDDKKFRLVVPFNAAQVTSITPGQQAEAFILEYLRSLPATVTEVSASGKAGSAGGLIYDVTVELENPGALLAGMQARVTVHTASSNLQSIEYGTLAEKEPVAVQAPAGGIVKGLQLEEGNMVEAGQFLLTLGANEKLPSQIETKQLQMEQIDLDLASKEAELANDTIYAPLGGQAVEVAASPGDEVRVGSLIATVVDYSSMQVVVPVDELDIDRIQVGQTVEVKADALPQETFEGKVAAVALEGRSQSGVATFDVTINIEQPGNLKVGMTVSAEILVAAKTDTLLVPIAAVQELQGRKIVMVLSNEQAPAAPEAGDGESQEENGYRRGSGVRQGPGTDLANGRGVNPAAPAPTASGDNTQGNIVVREVATGLHDAVYMEIVSGLEEGEVVLLPALAGTAGNRQGMAPVMFPGGSLGGGLGGAGRAGATFSRPGGGSPVRP